MAFDDALRQALQPPVPGDGALFAVLDGAQFDNLPGALLLGGFRSRRLDLDRGGTDPDRLITAPQPVWLDDAGAGLEAALTLLDGRPATVFWRCAAEARRCSGICAGSTW